MIQNDKAKHILFNYNNKNINEFFTSNSINKLKKNKNNLNLINDKNVLFNINF